MVLMLSGWGFVFYLLNLDCSDSELPQSDSPLYSDSHWTGRLQELFVFRLSDGILEREIYQISDKSTLFK